MTDTNEGAYLLLVDYSSEGWKIADTADTAGELLESALAQHSPSAAGARARG